MEDRERGGKRDETHDLVQTSITFELEVSVMISMSTLPSPYHLLYIDFVACVKISIVEYV